MILKHTPKFSLLSLFLLSTSHAEQATTAAEIKKNITPTEIIVVSANRQEQVLAEVASSVTLLDEVLLEQINATHINQILSQSAGTWISRGNGQEHLTAIRSPVFTGAGACGAFNMTEDGIGLRAAGFCNVNQLFASHYEQAQTIEVTRGANSAVQGANALFGGIEVILPQAGSVSDTLAVELGEYSYQRYSGQKNATIGQQNILLLATITDDGGYRQESGFKQQKISLKQQWQQQAWQIDSGLYYNNLDQQTAGYIYGQDAYKNRQISQQNENPEAYRKANAWRFYSKISWQEQDKSFTITPYFRQNEMEFLMHFVPWQPVEENTHRSFGNQLLWQQQLSPTLSYRLGLDIEFTEGSLTEIQQNPAPFAQSRFPQGAHYDFEVDAQNYALFLATDWQATPQWLISASVRADNIRYDYQNNLSSGSVCEQGINNCRFYRPAGNVDKFNFISYKVASNYQINDSSRFYLNLANGFRAPQVNELYRLQQGQSQTNLTEVKAISSEVGYRLWGENWQVNFAWYQMQRKNAILQNSERHNINAANTSHKGFEYEWSWQISQSVDVAMQGTFAQHQYDNDPDILGVKVALKGNDIDTAPKQLHSARMNWQLSNNLAMQLRWQKMAKYFIDNENEHQYAGHQLWSLHLNYQLSPVWSLALDVNNLANTDYAERADIAFGEYRYFPGQARTTMLSVRWQP